MKKKLISMCLIFIMLLSSIAYGNTNYNDKEFGDGCSSESTFNEYFMVKDLLNKSNGELYKMGYSVEEVEERRSINYEQIIYDRYVKMNGLKNNNSFLMRSMSADEFVDTLTAEQIASVTATCTVKHSLDSRDFYYSSSDNKTYAKINFSWKWSQEPVFHGIDIIGFGWDSKMYANINTSYVNIYYGMDGSSGSKTVLHRFKQYQTYNVSDTFDVTIYPFGTGTTPVTYYPKSGSGALNLYCTGKNQNLGVSYQYGHTYIGLSAPSISITSGTSPIGVGFSFSKNVTAYKSPLVVGAID